jgi:hypothetical protein
MADGTTVATMMVKNSCAGIAAMITGPGTKTRKPGSDDRNVTDRTVVKTAGTSAAIDTAATEVRTRIRRPPFRDP